MLLLNVKNTKKGFCIEIQNGKDAYRSESLGEAQIPFFCKEVVQAMISSAAYPEPVLYKAIPSPQPQKTALKDGVGLSDDHKSLIRVKNGKVEVLESGIRWEVAVALQLHVGHAIRDGRVFRGEW